MARNYHEPEYFRWSFGAFVQAARNVTWMLQSEKAAFEDFDAWYLPWREGPARPLLKWLNETRVTLTHRAALATRSWARFRCLYEQVHPDYEPDEDEDLYIALNPFKCTHAYIREGFVDNHGHEYQRAWEVEEQPGRELLELCADIYDVLAEIVTTAHGKVGAGMATAMHETTGEVRLLPTKGHHLPCMDDAEGYRTIRTYIRDGAEIWDDSPDHV